MSSQTKQPGESNDVMIPYVYYDITAVTGESSELHCTYLM